MKVTLTFEIADETDPNETLTHLENNLRDLADAIQAGWYVDVPDLLATANV